MREAHVTVNGVDIAYRETGEGPLALLLHGFPFTPDSYRFVIPALADAGYRVVAPFIRGFAPSAVPPKGREHMTDLVADANALHEALGGDGRAVLVGHDFGAATAWAAAVQAPHRWSRLIACDVPPLQFFGPLVLTPYGINVQTHFWFFNMAIADQVIAADDMAFLDFMLNKYTVDSYDTTPELHAIRAALRTPENVAAALGMYRSTFPADRFGTPSWMDEQGALWGALPSQPTLNIFGSEDVSFRMTAQQLDQIVEALPKGSAGALIEGARHVPMLEQPEVTVAHMRRFLAETA